MAPVKRFLTLAVALAVFAIGGTAQAEIITYQFTAEITHDSDPTEVIGVDVGDTVNGTFSFDTDSDAYVRDGRRIDVAYRDTGEIETDAVVIEGGTDGVWLDGTIIRDHSSRDRDLLFVGDQERNTTVTSGATGESTDVRMAVESVTFYFGDADALSGTDLPESLELDQFDGATYVVQVRLDNGQVAYAIGDITSLERADGASGGAAVPELSASGTASSLAVLIGSAYVVVNRRRRGATAG